VAGSRPRPSDGRWVSMSPSLRAGLTVVGLVAILVGWALNLGWFQPPQRSASAPRLYSEARSDRPVDTLWNEAEVAQREARSRARIPTPVPEPLPAPVAAPEPSVAAPVPPPAPVPAPSSIRAAAAAPAVAASAASADTAAPACECDPAAAARTTAPASKPAAAQSRGSVSRSSVSGSAGRRAGATVSVCALQRQYGIVDPIAGARSASISTPAGAASMRLQDRLGPDQRREQLRISIDGGASATLELGPARRQGSVSLRLPQSRARYRLSGYTEYSDGRRVPISGEGWLEPGARYELRIADEASGSLFLEPLS